MSEPLPILPVHLTGISAEVASAMSLPRPSRKREQIKSTLRTYITAANDATGAQLVLPPSPNRIQAQIIPQGPVGSSGTASSHGWLSATKAGAAAQEGAHISASGQGPVLTKTQSALYVCADPAASAVLVVTVIADYEGEPRFTQE